ncbi:hypothetical protein J4G37_26385 [Microvirga sp. 3-52]|nr:hypothetical protein [Microvirga sp. 3-52]
MDSASAIRPMLLLLASAPLGGALSAWQSVAHFGGTHPRQAALARRGCSNDQWLPMNPVPHQVVARFAE